MIYMIPSSLTLGAMASMLICPDGIEMQAFVVVGLIFSGIIMCG